MSFKIQPTPVARLNRCQLFGPGSRPEIFVKMAESAADVINLDLEDSVAPSSKELARNLISTMDLRRQHDYQRRLGLRIVSIRACQSDFY